MVHWNRQRAKNILLFQIVGLLAVLLILIISSNEQGSASDQSISLEIQASWRIPIGEPGIDWDRTSNGNKLIAVGDKTAELVYLDIETGDIDKKDFAIDSQSVCTL